MPIRQGPAAWSRPSQSPELPISPTTTLPPPPPPPPPPLPADAMTQSTSHMQPEEAGSLYTLAFRMTEREREGDTARDASLSTAAMCTDRAELMERIKRGESPRWVPNRALQEEYNKINAQPEPISPQTTSPLLPPAEIHEDVKRIDLAATSATLHSPYEIERPRSALHAGDFTRESTPLPTPTARDAADFSLSPPRRPDLIPPDTSPTTTTTTSATSPAAPAPWLRTSRPRGEYDTAAPWAVDRSPSLTARHSRSSSRAPSLSTFSSSSYVLKPPTTPLVHQSSNADLDFPSRRERSASPDKGSRRHTLPPHALRDWQAKASSSQPSPLSAASSSSPPLASRSYRRDITYPFAYVARRSNNWSLQPPSSPPGGNAYLRSRRTSFSSEASPRQRASMVGSYEESILHGRMSTAPSKPFDFTAHIGVLGRGKNPKMPPHVIIPFQAVFYDWASSSGNGRSRSGSANDEPSPYVGQINLANIEKPASPSGPGRAGYSQSQEEDLESSILGEGSGMYFGSPPPPAAAHTAAYGSVAAAYGRKTRASPRPEGGSYRIPQQGQIQVVIKNPYKTALKLFLVPYDLAGMQVGQKTFVRQRYYSAGPILERAVLSSPPTGRSSGALSTATSTTTPAYSASTSPTTTPTSIATTTTPTSGGTGTGTGTGSTGRKPTLRYLIHLNICCPAKGRYYLYQHVRVVFANRVPDDKEHLTKEVQEPRPKYSAWKPAGAEQRSEKSEAALAKVHNAAYRRRSAGLPFMDAASDAVVPLSVYAFFTAASALPTGHAAAAAGVDGPLNSAHGAIGADNAMGIPRANGAVGMSSGGGVGVFARREATPDASLQPQEGLLARRLRGLDVEVHAAVSPTETAAAVGDDVEMS